MVGLDDASLIWPEFLKLLFEKLSFLVRDGFLVQYQNVGNVVVVDLAHLSQQFGSQFGTEVLDQLTFSFRSLST